LRTKELQPFETSRTIYPTIRVLNKIAVRKSDLAKIVNVFNYGNVTNISSDDKSVTYGAHIWCFGDSICVLHQKL